MSSQQLLSLHWGNRWILELLFIILPAGFNSQRTVKNAIVTAAVIVAISMKDITCLVIRVSAHAVMSHPICLTRIILQEHVRLALIIARLAIILYFVKHVLPIISCILMQPVNFHALQVLDITLVIRVLLKCAAIVLLTVYSASMQVIHAHDVTMQLFFKMAFALVDALVLVIIN